MDPLAKRCEFCYQLDPACIDQETGLAKDHMTVELAEDFRLNGVLYPKGVAVLPAGVNAPVKR